MKPAPPLEWHPAYRRMTELLDWLENPSAPTSVKVAILGPPPTLTMSADELYPASTDTYKTMVLTKRKAWGPAPYVGPRFHYRWWTAVDQLGRMIGGESKIAYEVETQWWLRQGLEPPGDEHHAIEVPTPKPDTL